jgi:hypothetical protein
MVSVSVDEALTRVRDEKRRLRKEEKETMDFVEEEEMREEVRVWSESEESDERADAVAIEMEELFLDEEGSENEAKLENQSAKITVSSYNVVSFFFLPESVTFISRFIFCGFPDQTSSYQGTMHSTKKGAA